MWAADKPLVAIFLLFVDLESVKGGIAEFP